jgi:hypothetical protein
VTVTDAGELQRALDVRDEGAPHVFLVRRDGGDLFVAVPSA